MASAVRVGVVGVGAMGEIHARNLHRHVKGAQLVAIADADGDRAARLAAELGGARVHADGESLVGDRDIDAVVVAASDSAHAPLTLACIATGKPVLCEKPVALTVDDAFAVVEAQARRGPHRLVQIGFMREFDPAHAALRSAVASGAIGRPVLFRGTHINPDVAPFRMSAAEAIIRSMVHDIHSARFLTGLEMTEVLARSTPADDDPAFTRYVTLSAAMSGDALALIDVNIEGRYGYAVRAEVVGSHGSSATAHPRDAVTCLDGARHEPVTSHWRERFGDAYRREVTAWVDSVHTGQPAGPSAWDGLVAQIVAAAAGESLTTGRSMPVELPARPLGAPSRR